MDVFSTAAAGVALLGQLDACSMSIHRFIRDFRMAREDLRLLRYEVHNCRILASMFFEAVAPISTRVMQQALKKKLERRLQGQSKLAHNQIRAIKKKLKPLYHKNPANSFSKFLATVRWHFTKDDLQLPLAALGSVKASLSLLGTIAMLELATDNYSKVPEADSKKKLQILSRMFVKPFFSSIRIPAHVWITQKVLRKTNIEIRARA